MKIHYFNVEDLCMMNSLMRRNVWVRFQCILFIKNDAKLDDDE